MIRPSTDLSSIWSRSARRLPTCRPQHFLSGRLVSTKRKRPAGCVVVPIPLFRNFTPTLEQDSRGGVWAGPRLGQAPLFQPVHSHSHHEPFSVCRTSPAARTQASSHAVREWAFWRSGLTCSFLAASVAPCPRALVPRDANRRVFLRLRLPTFLGRAAHRKTGRHPRVKPEGMLFRRRSANRRGRTCTILATGWPETNDCFGTAQRCLSATGLITPTRARWPLS